MGSSFDFREIKADVSNCLDWAGVVAAPLVYADLRRFDSAEHIHSATIRRFERLLYTHRPEVLAAHDELTLYKLKMLASLMPHLQLFYQQLCATPFPQTGPLPREIVIHARELFANAGLPDPPNGWDQCFIPYHDVWSPFSGSL